jgi:protein-L-isoaspartate O-methyltransferase
MTATIAIPEAVRDRLKTYGHAGMTYPEILVALMDRVEREDFVRELRKQYASTPRRDYVKLEDL